MSKILVFAALAFVIYLLLRSSRVRRSRPRGDRPVESMVACEGCGVHLPRSEALVSQGRFYCSEEHRGRDVR
jgi:uncharacterized protein